MSVTSPVAPPATVPPLDPSSFVRPRRRALREQAVRLLLLSATLVGVVVLAVLLVDVLLDGLGGLDRQFMTSYFSTLDPGSSGVLAGWTGTLSLMVIVASLAFPLGVGAALYLEEFAAPGRLNRIIETNLSNLAGVPSVVYGLLGVGVFVYVLDLGRSLLAGGLTLVLLILPVIIVTSRQAIRAVPGQLREGGLGLGATPWQTAWKLVLPQAMPGIMTGSILGLSRAIGEAAPLLVIGAAQARRATSNPLDPFEGFVALPLEIFSFVGAPQKELQALAASAIIVLLGLLLTMNTIAVYLRNRSTQS